MITQTWLKKKYHYKPTTGIFTNKKNGKVLGIECKIHRLVWLYLYGTLPEKTYRSYRLWILK